MFNDAHEFDLPAQEQDQTVDNALRDEPVGAGAADLTNLMTLYLRDVRRFRPLDAQRETILVARMNAGSETARDLLICHHLGLVIAMARRFANRGLELLDLIGEGTLGLLVALERFDPKLGLRLSTYAVWWIRYYLQTAVATQVPIVRPPLRAQRRASRDAWQQWCSIHDITVPGSRADLPPARPQPALVTSVPGRGRRHRRCRRARSLSRAVRGGIMRALRRLPLGTQFGLLLAILIGVIVAAGAVVSRSIVIGRTLNEGRSVAQMVEHIGNWASQYGGLHVRTAGADMLQPGTYLERRMFAVPGDAQSAPRDSALDIATGATRVEAYHWKNPALIQREISDIAAASPSPVKFRITAKSVLNPNNAPSAFEREALDRIAAAFEREQVYGDPAKPAARLEYSKVEGGRLLYARVMMASQSCLRCHGSPQAAPGFLKTNAQFNGGGGFGYEVGKPAGIISVSIPLPRAAQALAESLTAEGWAALAAIGAVSTLLLLFVARHVIAPVNRLRAFADALASAPLGKKFDLPPLHADLRPGQPTANEVHRLAGAIGRLGRSLKYVYAKVAQTHG